MGRAWRGFEMGTLHIESARTRGVPRALMLNMAMPARERSVFMLCSAMRKPQA